MRVIELITLVLDMIGLVLISWYLFSIPEPVKFIFNQEYGVITSLQPIADAINSISRNIALINRMRYGFFILVISLILKLINWIIGCFPKKMP
jgi:hypothetical protein